LLNQTYFRFELIEKRKEERKKREEEKGHPR
jgi:hypothetical protein